MRPGKRLPRAVELRRSRSSRAARRPSSSSGNPASRRAGDGRRRIVKKLAGGLTRGAARTNAVVSMTTPRIDVAGPGDLAELVRLLGAQLHEHDIPATDSGMEKALRGMLDDPRRGTLFLARREGAPARAVGLACLSYTWTLELGGLSSWLDELYVEPALRGSGVGRALLLAAIAHARSIGAAAIDRGGRGARARRAPVRARGVQATLPHPMGAAPLSGAPNRRAGGA